MLKLGFIPVELVAKIHVPNNVEHGAAERLLYLEASTALPVSSSSGSTLRSCDLLG